MQNWCDWVRHSGSGWPKLAGALLLVAAVGVPYPAHADTAACAQEHASGQRETKAGRLKAAANLFAACGSSEDCPETIRAECVDLYRDVERNVPTVIFTATDGRPGAHARDITDVRVYATDQLLTESLDGRSLALDPGKYVLRFVLPEGKAVTTEVLVREGEKNRVVSVRMPPVEPQPSLAATESVVDPATQNSNASVASVNRPFVTEFWLSAGVGVAALVSFGAFALLGHNLQSRLNDCSPNCSARQHSDYDSMRRDYLFADISLGVSLVSTGVATWFYFANTRDRAVRDERKATFGRSRVSVVPLFTPLSIGTVVNANF